MQKIVLVVEDDFANQLVMRTLLERFGFTVRIASSGKAAVEAMSSQLPFCGLVLMDLNLCDMSGFQCTRLLKKIVRSQHKKTVPFIAVSAHDEEQMHAQCMEVGMDDYLSKPFTADELEALLLRWHVGFS